MHSTIGKLLLESKQRKSIEHAVNFGLLEIWLLRITGTVERGAFAAVVLPRNVMEAGHSWLGPGEMPEGAILNFLIRQASFTYGLHGVLLWLLSSDVVRFRPLIMFTGISYVLASVVLGWIDATSGMPWFWTLGDGGSCLMFGTVLLWLDWRAKSDSRPNGKSQSIV